MFSHTGYVQIDEDILDSLDRYAKDGIPTGSFLEAVLSNDLMDAMSRADLKNRAVVFYICSYVYNELPADCHGSRKKVAQWLETKAAEKAAAAEA